MDTLKRLKVVLKLIFVRSNKRTSELYLRPVCDIRSVCESLLYYFLLHNRVYTMVVVLNFPVSLSSGKVKPDHKCK